MAGLDPGGSATLVSRPQEGPRPGARLPEELARRTYRAYRRRQAGELLRLLPPDAVRPLYQRARAWAHENGTHDDKDPMRTLVRFCEKLLPLPPFHAWLRDRATNVDAHLRQLERGPDGDGDRDPFPVEVRSFRSDGEVWYATLGVYRADGAWRGFVAFHAGPDTPVHHTAEIFREETAAGVRARFRAFEPAALRAFLRSVRP